MITLGRFRLHLIMESDTRMDAGGPFGLVPRALYGRFMLPDADNTVSMPSHLLLVQTPDQNILIDAGNGDKLGQKQREIVRLSHPHGTVQDALARIGLAASDINRVILTHLHSDHCGGATRLDAGGAIQPVYPNAQYVVQRREYQDASHPNERTRATYFADNFEPLVQSGQMILLDGDTQLAPGVRVVGTPGHTPGHMSVVLESAAQLALFTGDLASFAIHFERLAWMTAYDVEPLVTLETKRRWQQWAVQTGALLIFPHDPQRPAGRLISVGDAVRVEPVDFAYA